MAQDKPVLGAVSVRRLTLSRYYLTIAKEHVRSDRELDAFLTINLLQEALETFLVAAADHLNAAVKLRTEFSTYLDKIDEAITPRRLPFRTTLIRINKARVQAKHDSLVPDRSEIPGFVASTSSFLEEASRDIFEIDFGSVSLVDLLGDGEAKEHLKAAQQAYDSGRHDEVLISCRKALYLTFEKRFDVAPFAGAEASKGIWAGLLCEAPQFARSPQYIDERILEPFDYIVIDHSRLDDGMIKDGLDPHIFWNLWRLTPQVYRPDGGDWLIKNEPDKFAEAALEQNSGYVLENTIELIYRRERKRLAIRTVSPSLWQIKVRTSGTPIYKKASKESEVLSTVPEGVEFVQVQSGTPALSGNGYFWRVIRSAEMQGNNWFSGYIHADDLVIDG